MAAIVFKTKYDYKRLAGKRVRNADGSEEPAPAAGGSKLMKFALLALLVAVAYKIIKK
jgi:hypothetical protein